jgi:hypothetical protein
VPRSSSTVFSSTTLNCVQACAGLPADAPDVAHLGHLDHLVELTARHRTEVTDALLEKAPANEFVLDHSNHHVPMRRRDGTVDQYDITIIDADLVHGLAGHSHQKCGLRVLDEDVVEVESRDAGVVRRRAEADSNVGGALTAK